MAVAKVMKQSVISSNQNLSTHISTGQNVMEM